MRTRNLTSDIFKICLKDNENNFCTENLKFGSILIFFVWLLAMDSKKKFKSLVFKNFVLTKVNL